MNKPGSEEFIYCARCHSQIDRDAAYCWVCYEINTETPVKKPQYLPERPVRAKSESVWGSVARVLAISLFAGLAGTGIVMIFVLALIYSFLTAIAEACSGCGPQIILFGTVLYALGRFLFSLFWYFV